MKHDTENLAKRAGQAKTAALDLAYSAGELRDRALEAMSRALEERVQEILEANRKDVEKAEADVAKGALAQPLLKRLMMSESKLKDMVEGILSVRDLPDPLGRTLEARELDQGLRLFKVTVPIGVIGVVFESRPDVVPQIASLCMKSGNAVIMKGGKEALESNRVLGKCLRDAAVEVGAPAGWLQVIETREEVAEILALHQYIDLMIPRGSNRFVQYVMEHTKIPVLGHSDGICHMYVHASADPDMACQLVLDAKMQYPAVCNAIETLLVDEQLAGTWLPSAVAKLREAGVVLKGDERVVSACGEEQVSLASEADWSTEYLDHVLSVRVVSSPAEAIDHINRYGSHHTDAIVAQDDQVAKRFLREVDSSSCMCNASTRFADGFRYGLGAEIGISTNKIHSRGPVGLEGLIIYKYILEGQGHLVSTYAGDGAKPFTHRALREEWSETS